MVAKHIYIFMAYMLIYMFRLNMYLLCGACIRYCARYLPYARFSESSPSLVGPAHAAGMGMVIMSIIDISTAPPTIPAIALIPKQRS